MDIDDLPLRERYILERNALAIQWFGLIRYVSRKLLRSQARFELLRVLGRDGIESIAQEALIKASRKWDVSRRVQFNTYACAAMTHEIFRELNTNGLIRVPVYLTKKSGKTSQHKKEADAVRNVSYFLPVGMPWDNRASLKEEEAIDLLGIALSRLEEKEQEVIRCRFWDGLNLRETGRKVGKSRTWVYLTERTSLVKLRRLLQAG